MACGCCENPIIKAPTLKTKSWIGSHFEPWCGYNTYLESNPRVKYKHETTYEEGSESASLNYQYSFEDEEFSYSIHQKATVTAEYLQQETLEISYQEETSRCNTIYIDGSAEGSRKEIWRKEESFDGYLENCECVVDQTRDLHSWSWPTYVCDRDGTPVSDCYFAGVCATSLFEIIEHDPPPTTETYHCLVFQTEIAKPDDTCEGQWSWGLKRWVELTEIIPVQTLEEGRDAAIADFPEDPEDYPNINISALTSIITITPNGVEGRSTMARKSEVQVEHSPTPTCYLRVWLQERWVPKGTMIKDGELTSAGEYIWNGIGNPCFEDPDKQWDEEENLILSEEKYELEVPEEEGILYLEIKKVSCIPGYIPDDPKQDGSRPDPDVRPNYYPL